MLPQKFFEIEGLRLADNAFPTKLDHATKAETFIAFIGVNKQKICFHSKWEGLHVKPVIKLAVFFSNCNAFTLFTFAQKNNIMSKILV